MSVHSYSRCWIHLIWATANREKLLNKAAAARVSCWLSQYADEQGVYMKINYVNAGHVHALVDLPTSLSIEKLIQLLKGSSSHWVNYQQPDHREICMGSRLRRFLRVRIKCRSGCAIYRAARGASSRPLVRGGVSKSSLIATGCAGRTKAVKTARRLCDA